MIKKISEIVKEKQNEYDDRIILVKVNGKLQEINEKEAEETEVDFVTTDSAIGNETYRRSAVMLMLYSIYKTAPKDSIKKVCVQYSLSKGLYCDMEADFSLTDKFLSDVKKVMEETIKLDIPFIKTLMTTTKAAKFFESNGMKEKAKLYKYRRSSYINVYDLDGYKDYFYGYMAPSTGYLKSFDLYSYDEGFVLQLPTSAEPEKVPDFEPQKNLFNVLKEATKWGKMLELDTIGSLNEHIVKNDIGSLILVQEAMQEQKIVEIVNEIKKKKSTKFVMIAGPSSSGKTTFANRLSIQLRANGYNPHPISVDNYFVERNETPLDENGQYNFEDLHAIDLKLFNGQMTQLLEGKEVELPEFNFKLGKKEYHGNMLKLGDDDILVIEGIHCLNDAMSESLPNDSKFKIYISALTQLNIDEHNRVATTDGRLLRRMVRDYLTRGASAERTLEMWPSVRKGEEKNIFPFQENADIMFNSAMPYELAILKPFVEPLLFTIEEDSPQYLEAKRLLKFLDYFLPCGCDTVPINSIVREFVGGGCFRV